MTLERRAFMHSWCGTIVVTESLPDWAAGGGAPAGKAQGPCPNSKCGKPDQPWWSSDWGEGTWAAWEQQRLDLEFDECEARSPFEATAYPIDTVKVNDGVL